MTKFASIILAATALSLTAPAAFAADVQRNDRLYDASGSSVAKVNRVTDNGDVLVIYKGKVRRVQAETLSNTDGKLMTTLTKKELRRLK
ncbi:hypothetical protein [Parasphingorhabdus cellanae]|uniref:Uncharacterized protein n=1 Tax=Parasphingorhabdus cellanae TaxID=2806553 RepID=A0ABX7T2L6_9SPHN|nr:hypothetical protein [Parasphingorhabdus cellanae]QTD55406.1 hypothetical protein J4G78_14520 [Parasphingorhabdus cellanae]